MRCVRCVHCGTPLRPMGVSTSDYGCPKCYPESFTDAPETMSDAKWYDIRDKIALEAAEKIEVTCFANAEGDVGEDFLVDAAQSVIAAALDRLRDLSNPVFYGSDGQWYFWDETWTVKHGAYRTHEECQQALTAYAETI